MSNEAALSLANARVDTSAALRGWLERECGLGSGESNEVALRLPEFVSLQASVRELLDASIRGGPFPAAALDRLNDASARVPRVLRFDANGACETPIASSGTPAVLARIAWSAIELLGAAERERPRRCGS